MSHLLDVFWSAKRKLEAHPERHLIGVLAEACLETSCYCASDLFKEALGEASVVVRARTGKDLGVEWYDEHSTSEAKINLLDRLVHRAHASHSDFVAGRR
jgi:hypothetical protein